MKKIMIILTLAFSVIIQSGCSRAKPIIPNPNQTNVAYIYIDDNREDNKALIKILKEGLLHKTENFSKDVYFLSNLDTLPDDGLFLEVSNIVKSVGIAIRSARMDVVMTNMKTNQVLLKRSVGASSRFQGFNHVSEGIVRNFQHYINLYGAQEIDKRYIPEWKDNKCVKYCNNVSRKYRM